MNDRLEPIVWELTTDRGAPCDHDLECGIISAVLTGTVRADELRIAADDFWSLFNRMLWPELLTAKDPTDLHAIVAASAIAGPLLDELEMLRDGQPFFVRSRIDDACFRVRELAAQRRLIEVLQDCDARLRIGATDVKGARALLSEFFRGAK